MQSTPVCNFDPFVNFPHFKHFAVDPFTLLSGKLSYQVEWKKLSLKFETVSFTLIYVVKLNLLLLQCVLFAYDSPSLCPIRMWTNRHDTLSSPLRHWLVLPVHLECLSYKMVAATPSEQIWQWNSRLLSLNFNIFLHQKTNSSCRWDFPKFTCLNVTHIKLML